MYTTGLRAGDKPSTTPTNYTLPTTATPPILSYPILSITAYCAGPSRGRVSSSNRSCESCTKHSSRRCLFRLSLPTLSPLASPLKCRPLLSSSSSLSLVGWYYFLPFLASIDRLAPWLIKVAITIGRGSLLITSMP